MRSTRCGLSTSRDRRIPALRPPAPEVRGPHVRCTRSSHRTQFLSCLSTSLRPISATSRSSAVLMYHAPMAAKKKTTPKKPANKSAFVRALPRTMPGADVVKKAKAAGINISLAYVYGIRAKSKPKGARRGPGRPPKSAATGNGATSRGAGSSGGLEAEIERIVEAKVSELLKARLGTLFG